MWLTLVGIALAALVAGCETSTHSAPSRTARGADMTPAIVISRDNGTLPRRCGVKTTAARMVEFIDAFNRGDAERLDHAIADRQHFQWYSSNEGSRTRSRTFSATGLTSAVDGPASGPLRHVDGRPALMRYLAMRSGSGERMRLVQVKITRVAPRTWFQSITDDVAGVEYSITLDAPDFSGLRGQNRLATGKGGFGCSDGRLLAWSMGLNTANGRPAHLELLCRRASRVRQNARRVIACSG